MHIKLDLFLLVLGALAVINCAIARVSHKPKLVIWSYDGLRYDMISPQNTPHLWKLRLRGVYSHRLTGVFPTKTFPNHFTLATGLYPEFHGVMGNQFYDWKKQQQINYSKEMFQFNEDVVPLWTLNEMNGGCSGCLKWPGSEFPFKNMSCSYKVPFEEKMSLYEMVNTVFDWLTNEMNPANLIMVYVNHPDRAGHLHGFASKEYMTQVKEIDEMVAYLHSMLKMSYLSTQVNVVHLSDHGMIAVSSKNIIDLTAAVSAKNYYKIYASSPVLQIVPENGTHDVVLTKLRKFAAWKSHFTIYDTSSLPVRWRVNNSRFGPIIAVADIGYAFQDANANIAKAIRTSLSAKNISEFALHGYDNIHKEMDGIFLAQGPYFGPAKVAGRIMSIDLFDMFCNILQFENIPKSNGSVENITAQLFERNKLEFIAVFVTIIFMVTLIMVIKMLFVIFERRKPYKSWK